MHGLFSISISGVNAPCLAASSPAPLPLLPPGGCLPCQSTDFDAAFFLGESHNGLGRKGRGESVMMCTGLGMRGRECKVLRVR